ncbi:MAG: methylmalonyl-CoA mutase [Candidatus Marinimicrobia bacterium]|nr:methylmalonyl-CoA mutase [Candidatus Neomarinimicrobiota bacterium]|tara:strand:+ start:285 stop:1928 length:1644 start_codon:yes stop_codon:yes gene_type:complete
MKKNKEIKEWLSKESKKEKRNYSFKSASNEEVDLSYFPENIDDSYKKDLGFPGQYPYTRSIHSNLYRSKLWTMRQFSGFGSPSETNKRFKYLLKQGQTGLSVAFDMPTLMGYDCDHKLSKGEIGHCGVSVSTLEDFEILFKDIDLSKTSVSMTINGPAVILFAFYVALAEKKNIDLSILRGTLQNDILKEYIAQKEWIYPPEPSIRLIVDLFEYCNKYMPKYNPVSVSGYHIREAGSSAIQELAFTLKNGFTYLDYAIKKGIDVDDIAPKISFFFNSHLDFFEEIAKFRAARKIWAKTLKEKYNAKNERSLKLRFHTQTAGFSLTAQQPENNIVRTSLQALAGVLGGTQSLHTNSMDETLALPSQKAAEIALRTQQVIAYESGVANVVDPLGGSWYIENLTKRIEREAYDYFNEVDELGGVVDCIESGYFQKEIAASSMTYQKNVDSKDRIIVGVNEFINDDESIDIPILKIRKEVEDEQISRINNLRNSRNSQLVEQKLKEISLCCDKDINLIPIIIEASKLGATLGEIVESMKKVFGEWSETSVI